jgi:hypothetical protein
MTVIIGWVVVFAAIGVAGLSVQRHFLKKQGKTLAQHFDERMKGPGLW